MIEQFIKFCVVGGSGVFVDFGLTYLFKERLRTNKYVANSAGFMCAASSNYVINRLWTFQSHDPQITRQYALFLFFSVIGLAINNGIIYLLTERVKFRQQGLNFYVAKLAAIGVVTLWNFAMNYLFTFS